MAIISIKNVCKYFGKKCALNDVSLDISEGELFGLLGVNGAGKTTLVKILCGISKMTSGSVVIDGVDLNQDLNKIKEIVDISPQETSVASNLTVKENLQFFANIYGNTNQDCLDEIVEKFGLGDVLNQRAKTLSGGYKRRLSIAIALISKPKVLFLDEPTLGLDVFARRDLWKIIENLKKNTTIILTSHYLDEVEHLCDRVAILESGKLICVGTVESLKETTNSETFEDVFVKLVRGVQYE